MSLQSSNYSNSLVEGMQCNGTKGKDYKNETSGVKGEVEMGELMRLRMRINTDKKMSSHQTMQVDFHSHTPKLQTHKMSKLLTDKLGTVE